MRVVFTAGTAGASGGTAVIKDMITFTKGMGYDTYIYCLDEGTRQSWLTRHSDIIHIPVNDIKSDDILIASEEFVWAIPTLSHLTSRYIILNQGLNASLVSDFGRNTYPVTKLIYQGALGVIGNSVHTCENITTLFELDKSKVHLYTIGVSDIFQPKDKRNVVSFMSRKNRAFGCFVINYLCGKYPEVQFVDINQMTQEQAADVYGRSRIFLSFGGPEGFGLPPLEAALCGCKVIGFDGGGGEEFFVEPIFTKIPFYDHMEFIKVAEDYLISEYDSSLYDNQRMQLKNHYSMDNARQSFYNAINNILGAHV